MSYPTHDPNQEKARLRAEIRQMREAYKRGLKGDEYIFWNDGEGHQVQLDALERCTPFHVQQARSVPANLPITWRSAMPDEKRE